MIRLVLGVLVAGALGVAILGAMGGDWVVALVAGGLGVGIAATSRSVIRPKRGRDPGDALSAVERFHELADPARPLTADDRKPSGTHLPTAPK